MAHTDGAPCIQVNGVTKVYPRREGPRILFGRGGMAQWMSGQRPETYAALRDVSLDIHAGESIGIIGGNGSGKSTLLKLLAGVTLPSSGEVSVTGRVASLLELGAGFHPMLTGRENIYLNASIYGLQRAEVDRVFDDIVAFSGIGEFIDRPVDTYSSGMYVRVAFSVAVHVNPDIFLVDEVLAVGDEEFQRKCRRKMGELREQGKTIVFVSHDLGVVNTVCNRVVLLSKGELIDRGSPQQTFDYYLRQIGQSAGIHRLAWGGHEALFSNGKLSLFKDNKELTAPEGIQLLIESLGQTHGSTQGDWKITRADETSFTATGTMPRLPCSFEFDVRVENGALSIRPALLPEHAFELDSMSLVVPMPTQVDRWVFGENVIEAPEITPAHVNPEPASMANSDDKMLFAFSSRQGDDPGLMLSVMSGRDGYYLQLMNGDFLSGLRRLYWTWRPAPGERRIAPNNREAVLADEMQVRFTEGDKLREMVSHLEQRQRCESAGLRTRLREGRLEIETIEGISLGEIQALFSAGHLWTNSTFLNDHHVQREGDTTYMNSNSVRLPVALRWEVRSHAEGMRLVLKLRANKPIELQEFNFSWLLPAGYEEWAFEHEHGRFASFHAEQEWRPLNQRYEHSGFARASAAGLPTLEWRPTDDTAPLPSALNTGAGQHRRVLQWLCRPQGADAFYFDAGTHSLLDVVIRVVE